MQVILESSLLLYLDACVSAARSSMSVISNKCRVVTVVTGAGCGVLLVSAATLALTIQSDIGRDQLHWSPHWRYCPG